MKKGFTLVELLVVIAVIGILSAIITPNLLNARNSARIAAGQRFDSSVYHSIGDYLVGEWMFDVVSSSLIDTSGFGSDATNNGATYVSTSGYNGRGAYSFNGSTSYLSIPSSCLAASVGGNITVSGWVYLNSCANWSRLIDFGNGSTNSNIVFAVSNGSTCKPTVDIYNSSTRIVRLLSPTAISTGQWTFLATTVNGLSGSLYINGQLVFSDTLTSALVPIARTINYVGKSNWPDSLFNGLIDDLRIYNSALSASDIQKLYAKGVPLHGMASNAD